MLDITKKVKGKYKLSKIFGTKISNITYDVSGEFDNDVSLDMPRLTYEKNGKEVVIQGMIHVATKKFYDRIQKIINSIPAGSYLYEKIKASPENKLQNELKINSLVKQFAKLVNGVLQIENIKEPKNAINSDIDANTFIDKMGKNYFKYFGFLTNKADQFLKKFSWIFQSKKVLNLEFGVNDILHEFSETGKFPCFVALPTNNIDKHIKEILVDFRNRILVDDIEKYSQVKPKLFVTYGLAHLSGIDDILRNEKGWVLKKIDFLRMGFNFKKTKISAFQKIMKFSLSPFFAISFLLKKKIYELYLSLFCWKQKNLFFWRNEFRHKAETAINQR